MAFGIDKNELKAWKAEVKGGNVAFLTHYWMDERFPGCFTVTKAGCSDLEKLVEWGMKYGLRPQWIHRDKNYPHFDLVGDKQKNILVQEGLWEQITRFNLLS